MARKTGTKQTHTAIQFCETWQAAGSAADVVSQLGLSSTNYACRKASLYRSRGINLKKMPQGRGPSGRVDAAAINRRLAQMNGKV